MKKPEGKAEAGWYDAPEIIGYEQYWDGSKWLSQKRSVGSNEELKKSPDFIVAISNGFIKVFDYKGKAKRYEFWYFVLFYYLATQIGSVLLASLNLAGLLILSSACLRILSYLSCSTNLSFEHQYYICR